ncbi:hypothetical protein ACF1BQ_036335 [Bradyrhizobium sp. RDT10]
MTSIPLQNDYTPYPQQLRATPALRALLTSYDRFIDRGLCQKGVSGDRQPLGQRAQERREILDKSGSAQLVDTSFKLLQSGSAALDVQFSFETAAVSAPNIELIAGSLIEQHLCVALRGQQIASHERNRTRCLSKRVAERKPVIDRKSLADINLDTA